VPQQPPPSSAPAASSVVVRGRNRELQQLNNEMQLLQVRPLSPCLNCLFISLGLGIDMELVISP